VYAGAVVDGGGTRVHVWQWSPKKQNETVPFLFRPRYVGVRNGVVSYLGGLMVTATGSPAAPPSSPRSAAPSSARSARREAICEAVFELLGEVGYDQMSMDAVAARARSSKATIYRAWPCKPDLVIDAIVQRFGGAPEAPDTGTLRGDLVALMSGACQLADSRDGAVMAGLMSAAARNSELSQTLQRCLYEMKHVVHQTIIERAIARGELVDGTDPALLHEVLHAMVFSRQFWAGGPIDDVFVVHVVDDVLLPVLKHQRDA
jgi:AcrR family transcriptional regulator